MYQLGLYVSETKDKPLWETVTIKEKRDHSSCEPRPPVYEEWFDKVKDLETLVAPIWAIVVEYAMHKYCNDCGEKIIESKISYLNHLVVLQHNWFPMRPRRADLSEGSRTFTWNGFSVRYCSITNSIWFTIKEIKASGDAIALSDAFNSEQALKNCLEPYGLKQSHVQLYVPTIDAIAIRPL